MRRRLWAAYCWVYGHCWLPMPEDIFEPLLCHRCGYVIHPGRPAASGT